MTCALSGVPQESTTTPTASLSERYQQVRQRTLDLTQPLTAEDMVVQSMQGASPTKWHLAHTTWFFERFVLLAHTQHEPIDEAYDFLFNSYYNTVGPQHCQARRGLLGRPSLDAILHYRMAVDEAVVRLLEQNDALVDEERTRAIATTIVLGLHHEQQHQELLLTDIKHALSSNPMLPAYREVESTESPSPAVAMRWIDLDPGLVQIGHLGDGFAFDNESPRHRVFIEPMRLANRLVTNGEYLAFLQDGGYQRPELWLSMGLTTVQEQSWTHPLYWYQEGDRWMQYTLAGPQALAMDEPISHVSYFEADAYARWADARLPREAEWEYAADTLACVDDEPYDPTEVQTVPHPRNHSQPLASYNATADQDAYVMHQRHGCLWQWTLSQYEPYPGYHPPHGAIGEYNGKFMCNQFVLRGSSLATPPGHARNTYRNFFSPDARWQYTGIRLAKDG